MRYAVLFGQTRAIKEKKKNCLLSVDSNWLPWWRIKWLYFLLGWPEILYCLKIVILLCLCQLYNWFLSFKYCQSHLCLHKSCLFEKKETPHWTMLNLLLRYSRVGNTGLRGAMKRWLEVNWSSGAVLGSKTAEFAESWQADFISLWVR